MGQTSHSRERARKMRTSLITRAAQSVRAAFVRRQAPGDPDDIAQDAAVAACEAFEVGRITVRTPSAMAYLRTAGRREAGLELSRALSAVHFPEKKAREARTWQDRVRVEGCGYASREESEAEDVVVLCGGEEPEHALMVREGVLLGKRIENRMRMIIARHLVRMSDAHRRALELLLGLGTEAAEDVAEVSWRTGLPHASVRDAIGELTDRLRNDREAVVVRRAMIEAQEV